MNKHSHCYSCGKVITSKVDIEREHCPKCHLKYVKILAFSVGIIAGCILGGVVFSIC